MRIFGLNIIFACCICFSCEEDNSIAKQFTPTASASINGRQIAFEMIDVAETNSENIYTLSSNNGVSVDLKIRKTGTVDGFKITEGDVSTDVNYLPQFSNQNSGVLFLLEKYDNKSGLECSISIISSKPIQYIIFRTLNSDGTSIISQMIPPTKKRSSIHLDSLYFNISIPTINPKESTKIGVSLSDGNSILGSEYFCGLSKQYSLGLGQDGYFVASYDSRIRITRVDDSIRSFSGLFEGKFINANTGQEITLSNGEFAFGFSNF